MEMSSVRSVPASVETTWKALNDPEILRQCIPGCEVIERVGEDEYKIAMVAKVGPVSAKFNGRMKISDIVPPQSYAIAFEGQGGAAGFAKGSAKVRLEPEGAGTRMAYDVNAQIGGKLAQIGSRLVDGAARKVADEFFAVFSERVQALGAPPAVAAETAPATAAPVPVSGAGLSGNKAIWWVGGIILIVVIAYLLFRR